MLVDQAKEMCEPVAEELPELVVERTSIDCGVTDMAELFGENVIMISRDCDMRHVVRRGDWRNLTPAKSKNRHPKIMCVTTITRIRVRLCESTMH
jgi:hypothetical protein